MKSTSAGAFAIVGLMISSIAVADWHTLTITHVQLVPDNTGITIPDVPSNVVIVWGSFTPALPCTRQAFIFFPADPLFKETYSMLVAAKLTGTSVNYLHIYCQSSGISRGNEYQLAN